MTPHLKSFRQMEIDRFKLQHPNIPYPESFFANKAKYDDKTANGLTRLIIRYLEYHGWQAERISTTGRVIDTTKVVSNVLGGQYRIGTTTWIPGSGKRGSADISATINGRSVKIEVKIAKDRQSEHQKEYQQAVERAGGVYMIARDFEGFVNQLNQILTQNN